MKKPGVFWKDAKRFMKFWRIECDRRLAKGRLSVLEIVLASCFVLVLIPALLWAAGCLVQYIYSILPIESCEGLKNGSFWNTIESYLNPSNHKDDGISFSHRLYYFVVGFIGVLFLNGLLVSFLVSCFESRREKWENGLLHYKQKALGAYSVIVGGNEMVPHLAGELLKSLDYVVIMTNRDVSSLRKKLLSSLGEDFERRVVIYYGERTSVEDLKLLELQGACEIYVIGEQLDIFQKGSHHDVKNLDCVQKMSLLLKGNIKYTHCIASYHERKDQAKRLKEAFDEPDPRKLCHVMFEYQSTFSVFQIADVNSTISEMLDFKPFNFYEIWAQKVMVCQSLTPEAAAGSYLPLEGTKPITKDSDDTVHLIVVGMGRMGIAMAVEAAHLAHYPNFITHGKRTRITFIDSEARREMNFFQGHYKELFSLSRWRYIEFKQDCTFYDGEGTMDDIPWNESRLQEKKSPYRDENGYTLGKDIVDIEWQFIKGDLEMPSVQRFIREESLKTNSRLNIAICIPKDNASLAASLYLPDEVYQKGNSVVQVLVYQPYGNAMMNSFDKEKDETKSFMLFSKLRAFGMIESCYELNFQHRLDEISDLIGRQYKTVSMMMRSSLRGKAGSRWSKPKTVGKTFAAKQWSNLYNGQHMWTKLRSAGFAPGNHFDDDTIELLSKVEHVRWNVEQLLLGFAPLNSSEQMALVKKQGSKAPDVKLDDNGDKVLNSEEVSKWLQSWEAFDTMKEILKSNMSHADLCSYDRLREVDRDAMIYDRELVRILPEIYSDICSKQEN